MLNIFNNLDVFFENSYKKISVREYSRIKKVSPPTASKLLKEYTKKGLLKFKKDRIYYFFYPNINSDLFIDLSKIYWKEKIKKSGLIEYLKKELIDPKIILFGSLSKGEIKENSDIDLAVFSITKKDLDLKKYEKKLKRKIDLFLFENLSEIKSEHLKNSILNGFRIEGEF